MEVNTMPDIKPIILGQAPGLLGDGRPFTGPSGHTLCTWAGVRTRDELMQYFDLANLINHPLPRKSRDSKQSTFRLPEGRQAARQFLFHTRRRVKTQLGQQGWGDFIDSGSITVVALGIKVWRSFGLPRSVRHFEECPLEDGEFKFVCFPHPSGLNHQLNDPIFREQVQMNLRRIGGLPIA
jgi:hypothetical protein